ncbi:MAG: hypothetical protein JXR10_12615 [Cyclobacteriaceae bacterium]
MEADSSYWYISFVNEWEKFSYEDLDEVISVMEQGTIGTCDSVFTCMFVTQDEIPFITVMDKEKGQPCFLYSCYNAETKRLCSDRFVNLFDFTRMSHSYDCD